eukprot:scaffold24889_cov67-Phaeocystis_antarctica.AAC.1
MGSLRSASPVAPMGVRGYGRVGAAAALACNARPGRCGSQPAARGCTLLGSRAVSGHRTVVVVRGGMQGTLPVLRCRGAACAAARVRTPPLWG